MPRLEDLSIGHRIALTFIIVLVILFALALYGYLTGGWDVEAAPTMSPVPSYKITKYEGEMLEIEHKAIDEAFHNAVVNVFGIWMKDATGQPGRALVGVTNARNAYIAAKTRLDEREVEYKRSIEGR
jgi:hypothetical protein